MRRGDVSRDDWWRRSPELDAAWPTWSPTGRTPRPDRGRIDAWLIATHQAVWACGQLDGEASERITPMPAT